MSPPLRPNAVELLPEVDLEAPPLRLFHEIDDALRSLEAGCDASLLSQLRADITRLEVSLASAVCHDRITLGEVERVKTALLGFLQVVVERCMNHRDRVVEEVRLEGDFRLQRFNFISSISRQHHGTQLLCFTTLSKAQELLINKVLAGLAIIAVVSLAILMINHGHNHILSEVFAWIFIIAVLPFIMAFQLLIAAHIVVLVCGDCIDYCRTPIPENHTRCQVETIATSLYGIFEERQRTVQDFKDNPHFLPRNMREIALKLWFLHISNAELLSCADLEAVLAEYAKHLGTCKRRFRDAVAGDFVDKLLSYPVDARRQQLKSAMASSDKVSEKQSLATAIANVAARLEADIWPESPEKALSLLDTVLIRV